MRNGNLSHCSRELSLRRASLSGFPIASLTALLTPRLQPMCHSGVASVLGLPGQPSADRTHILPDPPSAPLAGASLRPPEAINLRRMLLCLIVLVAPQTASVHSHYLTRVALAGRAGQDS